jgi:hypothetical protein
MQGRRFDRRVSVLAILVLGATRAFGASLPFVGELSIEIHGVSHVMSLPIDEGGTIEVNPAGGLHLVQANLAADAFHATGLVASLTSSSALAPIRGVQLTGGNAAGAFAEAAGGRFGGAMPLAGTAKLCLFGPCSAAVVNISLPLSKIGQPATTAKQAAVNLTVRGAPWTTGTVQVGAVSAHGSARGPASLPSSTAQLGGTLSLVTPIFVSSNLGAEPIIPTFGRLHLLFGGTPDCSNGIDDDGDGLVDYPADPDCSSPTDPSEGVFVCSNGIDDDGDGLIDYPEDPGCASPTSDRERTLCQDGIDNDGDGRVDFDGGASANHGVPVGPPDPKCVHPYDRTEVPACGLGVELVAVLGALEAWRRRIRR